MSVNNNKRDFSKYDSMSTEQLEEILRLDAEMPEGSESDTEELFYIMEVLAVRRKKDPSYTGKSAQQAFETFKNHYMPNSSEADTNIQPAKPKKRISWLRRLTAAAAVLAIIILTTTTANAFGYDLWGKIAVWSDEFFQFTDNTQGTTPSEPNQHDKLEYTSLQEALDALEITQHLAPARLPDGCELDNIFIMRTPQEQSVYALYKTADGSSLTISIRQFLTSVPEKTEKSEGFVEVYEAGGITYYLFNNMDDIKAAWTVAEFECYISGYITTEEMKEMIDSI